MKARFIILMVFSLVLFGFGNVSKSEAAKLEPAVSIVKFDTIYQYRIHEYNSGVFNEHFKQTVEKLKKEGFWIIGLAGEAKSDLKSIPKDVKLAVVIGSEGKGISQLVRKHCDLLVKIPMLGHVSCLNASVAAGIVLYHIRNNM